MGSKKTAAVILVAAVLGAAGGMAGAMLVVERGPEGPRGEAGPEGPQGEDAAEALEMAEEADLRAAEISLRLGELEEVVDDLDEAMADGLRGLRELVEQEQAHARSCLLPALRYLRSAATGRAVPPLRATRRPQFEALPS
jgi:hypothetical protein